MIPGALTPTAFRQITVETGEFLWGTVQGAFNEKQTINQILVDAAIGMIPVVGDVTAVRDLIAVGSGLAMNPAKRERSTEWVLLVVLLFALIPVLGGVIKGIGRLALRVSERVAKDHQAMAALADSMILFLNRVGHKHASAWLKSLDLMKYERELLKKFREFCDVFIVAIHICKLRMANRIPSALQKRMDTIAEGFTALKSAGEKMIPVALKDLHSRLCQLQKYIHAGGMPSPSTATVRTVQSGQKTVTYAEEARLLETRPAKPLRHAGKFPQNFAASDKAWSDEILKVYKHEPGYPNLLQYPDPTGTYYPSIAAASGVIKNERLSGVTLFRSFGDGGTTMGVAVAKSNPIGAFWGIGMPPRSATEWRGPNAVMDEWNRNGWLSILHIPPTSSVLGCTSTVSEQFGKNIPGQYLEGGARQAVVAQIDTVDVPAIAKQLWDSGGGDRDASKRYHAGD